jgi:hypothetical protein
MVERLESALEMANEHIQFLLREKRGLEGRLLERQLIIEALSNTECLREHARFDTMLSALERLRGVGLADPRDAEVLLVQVRKMASEALAT